MLEVIEFVCKYYINAYRFRKKGSISEKEMKYFAYDYKNASNLGKLFFLPKIQKRLSNVPGRPVISNCGTPSEKLSEFLDYNLKPVMKRVGPISKIQGIL